MTPLLANISEMQFWLAIPLIIAISFVYGATRHELMWPIIQHSFRAATWIVTFMMIIFVVLWWCGWGL